MTPNIRNLTKITGGVHFTPEFLSLSWKMIRLIILSTIVVCIQGVILWIFDREDNPTVNTPYDGIYLMVVSVFGETTAPATIMGRVITLIALLEGLILGAYVFVVAALFNLRGSGVLMRPFSDHIVICGWNFHGSEILRELLEGSDDNICVIPGDASFESQISSDKRIRVIDGNPTMDHVLQEAGIDQARSAIILTDSKLDPGSADAKTLMIGLAVESKNPDVYTCAQLMDSDNEIHLVRANVDEVILLDTIGANLAVASAVNPGVTQVVNELITFNEGSEFYRIQPLPARFLGVSFTDAASVCRESHTILIGVELHSENRLPEDVKGLQRKKALDEISRFGRTILVNPEEFILESTDSLFIIADERPRFS